MEPVTFPEANKNLYPPKNWDKDTKGECGILPIFNDGEQCVSKWKLTWLERLKALWYGHIWVFIVSGHTQPPIKLSVDKTVFTTYNLWKVL